MNVESGKNRRRQLTLFISESESSEIERCRKLFNIEQYKIINCHITLCREDEIEALEKVKVNLSRLNGSSFVLELGKPERFSYGKGVLLPVIKNNYEFQKLRINILTGIIDKPRTNEPHITLMHPRNSTCTDEIFEKIQKMKFPDNIRINKISLIEQNIGECWNILEEYDLKF